MPLPPRPGVADRLLHLRRHGWAAKPLPLRPGPGKSGLNAITHHRPLELGEHAHHLEKRLAARRGGVHPLLVQVEVDVGRLQVAQEGHPVL